MKKQITLLILIVASILNAQEKPQTYSFSLQQAIDHALQNNYSAINAGRDIESSKEKKWETIAAGLPQINANVSYLNNFKIQQNQFTVNGQTNTISFI
jgi:outer membrane protein TolC